MGSADRSIQSRPMGAPGSADRSIQSRPMGAPGSISSDGNYAPQPPEPDARNFKILDLKEVYGWTVALVHYPGCTTYEGKKCLVFACPPSKVALQKLLDPHFLEQEDCLSPVARFEPTEYGVALAMQLCVKRNR